MGAGEVRGRFRGSVAGLCRSLNQTNQRNQPDQMNQVDQLPATRREMLDC